MDPPVSKDLGKKLSCVEVDMEQQQDYCVDRISNLPPELIGNILSLLPTTKQAVATSVLSSRWKWLWTFITCLNFIPDLSSGKILKPSFISFVYRVLLHRNHANLDYFGLRCVKTDNVSHLREWVSAALLADVKELDLFDITVTDTPTNILPFDLFSSKNLVTLALDMCFFTIQVPHTVCLPSLEVLSLYGVRFCDKDSLRRILIGCPLLEELRVSVCYPIDLVLPRELFSSRKLVELELTHCEGNVPSMVSLPSLEALILDHVYFPDDGSAKRLICGCPSLLQLNITIHGIKVLHIAAQILKKLTVAYDGWGNFFCGKVVLETPSLQYLKVDGMTADSFELKDLNQLLEADLNDTITYGPCEVVTDLMMGISNVKMLRLCGLIIKRIVRSGSELPKFHNLTTLKLGLSNDVGWALLPDLLENSRFLETLVFESGLKEDSADKTTWRTPQNVPYCLLHHLKVIQINFFRGDIEGEEIIQYFIENRGVLNDLTIQYSSDWGELWDNVEED